MRVSYGSPQPKLRKWHHLSGYLSCLPLSIIHYFLRKGMVLMELEFFYIKKIMVSQPSQLKLKRVANHYLKRFFFFCFFNIQLKFWMKKPHPYSTKKFIKFFDKHYYYAYHHIWDNSSCTACREIQNLKPAYHFTSEIWLRRQINGRASRLRI